MSKLPRLAIVVPCYNEEAVLPLTAPVFLDTLTDLAKQNLICDTSSVVFVDDGSKDSTWQIITDLSSADSRVVGLKQSRNRGHQSTVLAGLLECKTDYDVTISIDADGQDDPGAMAEMLRAFHTVLR